MPVLNKFQITSTIPKYVFWHSTIKKGLRSRKTLQNNFLIFFLPLHSKLDEIFGIQIQYTNRIINALAGDGVTFVYGFRLIESLCHEANNKMFGNIANMVILVAACTKFIHRVRTAPPRRHADNHTRLMPYLLCRSQQEESG